MADISPPNRPWTYVQSTSCSSTSLHELLQNLYRTAPSEKAKVAFAKTLYIKHQTPNTKRTERCYRQTPPKMQDSHGVKGLQRQTFVNVWNSTCKSRIKVGNQNPKTKNQNLRTKTKTKTATPT